MSLMKDELVLTYQETRDSSGRGFCGVKQAPLGIGRAAGGTDWGAGHSLAVFAQVSGVSNCLCPLVRCISRWGSGILCLLAVHTALANHCFGIGN